MKGANYSSNYFMAMKIVVQHYANFQINERIFIFCWKIRKVHIYAYLQIYVYVCMYMCACVSGSALGCVACAHSSGPVPDVAQAKKFDFALAMWIIIIHIIWLHNSDIISSGFLFCMFSLITNCFLLSCFTVFWNFTLVNWLGATFRYFHIVSVCACVNSLQIA